MGYIERALRGLKRDILSREKNMLFLAYHNRILQISRIPMRTIGASEMKGNKTQIKYLHVEQNPVKLKMIQNYRKKLENELFAESERAISFITQISATSCNIENRAHFLLK